MHQQSILHIWLKVVQSFPWLLLFIIFLPAGYSPEWTKRNESETGCQKYLKSQVKKTIDFYYSRLLVTCINKQLTYLPLNVQNLTLYGVCLARGVMVM